MKANNKTIASTYRKVFKDTEVIRAALVDSLIKAGKQGLTVDQILDLTGQSGKCEDPGKCARQSMRRSRFILLERGYRLAREKEKIEGRFVVYRAVKITKGIQMPSIFRKEEVIPYKVA